jgi:mono/diheme cytochrome c family protein
VDIAEKMTEADQISLVRTGRGRMPPFAPALSNADIAAVVAYIRTQLDHPSG